MKGVWQRFATKWAKWVLAGKGGLFQGESVVWLRRLAVEV
jgi:hypothetical protein